MNQIKLTYFFFLFMFIVAQSGVAQQTKEQLEKTRKERMKKVQEISQILQQTRADRYSSLDELKAINRQLYQRTTLLESIREELVVLDVEMKETDAIIKALERDVQGLIDEYKLMVYHASKGTDSYQRISYLLSSKSFNQFLSRVSYMNQYHDARQNQITQIKKVRDLLAQKRQLLIDQKLEKEELLNTEKAQNVQLADLRQKQGRLIDDLRKKETELRKQLNIEKINFKKLTDLVVINVSEGLESVKEEPTGDDKEDKPKLNPTAKKIASSFEQNKGKLIWPVEEGFISSKFGMQQLPGFEHLVSENIGVDIRTNEKQPVRAVFAGKVIAVTKVPGMNYLVMVQHGSYFTVYARLKKVNVSVGGSIQEGGLLGTVATNEKDVSELQFQVWRNDNKLDPEEWLKK